MKTPSFKQLYYEVGPCKNTEVGWVEDNKYFLYQPMIHTLYVFVWEGDSMRPLLKPAHFNQLGFHHTDPNFRDVI